MKKALPAERLDYDEAWPDGKEEDLRSCSIRTMLRRVDQCEETVNVVDADVVKVVIVKLAVPSPEEQLHKTAAC